MRTARTKKLRMGNRRPKDTMHSASALALERGRKALYNQYQSLRQAQSDLAASRNHYEELFETAPVCFVTLTQTGLIREINSSAIRLLDPSKKQLIGTPFISFIDRGDRRAFLAHLSRCRYDSGAGQSMSVELKLARQAGERPIFIELVSMASPKSERTLFKSIFRDVTDIREMREVHRWLATIVESSADGIIGKDTDGLIISCNRGAERLFGYTCKELIGKPMTVLIPKKLQHEELQILRRLRRGEKMERYATVRQRKDGTHVPVSLTISPIRDDRGEIIGISNVSQDLSERKEGRRKLEEILIREGSEGAADDMLMALTRESLQRIIEDQEVKNDELQSANEEIVSTNEELQSTNEELETAKEELQSTNEELVTLNDELKSRNNELEQVNCDLHNLLANVNIPIIVLGSDLKIRRFSATAGKLFKLNLGDIGKRINDVALPLNGPGMDAQLVDVFTSPSRKDIEVRDKFGRWWSVRIRRYKTTDHKIDGTVIALLDIDAIKSGEKSREN